MNDKVMKKKWTRTQQWSHEKKGSWRKNWDENQYISIKCQK
jgi:hypothetical protein